MNSHGINVRTLLGARVSGWFGADWIRPEVYAWAGLVAIMIGLRAQRLLSGPVPSIGDATRWYAFAIGVLLAGWWGSYTNQSLLIASTDFGTRFAGMRLGVAARAVILNAFSLPLIFYSGPSVALGVVIWFASLGLFLYAFRTRGALSEVPSIESSAAPWRWPWRIEALAFLVIMTVAVIMRLWRLGDLGPGMHGDEGEAGASALSILHGNLVSPFERGWSTQSNVYYWTIAICLRVFGTGLVGLRSFAVMCGLATVVFVYFLARELFGIRCAIIAGAFLSFQTGDLIFSRQQFSNDTVPFFLAGMAYFLAHGIRTRRHIEFAIAGTISGFALYYYAGGRLVAPTGLIFLGYLAVTRRNFLRGYWTHVSTFVVGTLLTSGPFIAYNYYIAPIQGVGYPNDRFVWYHEADLAALYGVSGWPAILWNQLTRTLSIITYSFDVSAMQVGQFPIARPLESVLIVFGLAWALCRWRDARFALLSIWFWTSIVVGGVLTNEAPDLPRIVGILSVMPILIGVVLDHLCGQFQLVVTSRQALRAVRGAGTIAGLILVIGATAVAGVGNWQTYADTYMNNAPNQLVSIQANYVGTRGPSYFYEDLGAYFPQVATLYWGHGDNRYLNPSALGEDVTDLSTVLPVANNGPTGQQDVIFLVWTFSPAYKQVLNTLKQIYPHGVMSVDHELLRPGQSPLLVAYTVSHRELNPTRTLRASFVSADGRKLVVLDRSSDLGSLEAPPGEQFPVRASWAGTLMAPTAGAYVFEFSGPPGSSFSLDGQTVVRPDALQAPSTFSIVLARGRHQLRMSSSLRTSGSHIGLKWMPPGGLPGTLIQNVPRQFVWDGQSGK